MINRRQVIASLSAAACGAALWTAEPLARQSAAPQGAVQQAPTLRVYLARHGQTDGNLKGIAQGWTDTPLNETGMQQAAALAERLRGVHLDAVYSSTLARSRATAEAVAAGRALQVRSLAGLREIGLGRFENVALNDPLLKQRPLGEQRGPDDGEAPSQVTARVREAIDTIRKAHPAGTILIVGHAGANGYVMRALLNVTPEEMAKNGRYVQDNDELYMIELTQGFAPRVYKFIPPGKFNEL
jgi:broad specificity phosphatase PhoE